MADVDISRLNTLFEYDPVSGALTWRRGRKSVGGRPAGTLWENGYTRVRVDGVYLYAHRVVFALTHGYWPEQVDHVNGNRQDNRVENLRACTNQQNQWNARKRGGAPTSAHKGVYWSTQKSKWQARIVQNYKAKHLGFFDDENVAGAAYARAAGEIAGQFARVA